MLKNHEATGVLNRYISAVRFLKFNINTCQETLKKYDETLDIKNPFARRSGLKLPSSYKKCSTISEISDYYF